MACTHQNRGTVSPTTEPREFSNVHKNFVIWKTGSRAVADGATLVMMMGQMGKFLSRLYLSKNSSQIL